MTTKTYCDKCGAEPAHEAFQYDSPMAGPGPLRGDPKKDLDLCAACHAALLAHIDRFFSEKPGAP